MAVDRVGGTAQGVDRAGVLAQAKGLGREQAVALEDQQSIGLGRE